MRGNPIHQFIADFSVVTRCNPIYKFNAGFSNSCIFNRLTLFVNIKHIARLGCLRLIYYILDLSCTVVLMIFVKILRYRSIFVPICYIVLLDLCIAGP